LRALSVVVLLALIVALAPAVSRADTDTTAKITDIEIKGNVKVEADTIRTKMSLKVGDLFMPDSVRKDIDAIYKMGYFDDVRVEAEGYAGGLRLIFTVVERPIIRSYTFEGNESIESSKLREKVTLTPYSIYNPALVSDNVQAIQQYYQGEGYFKARVMPIIDRISDKEVKIIFLVDEGGKVRIDDIEFVGNENISSRTLRKAMTTKEYFFLWSWLTGSGTYKVADMSMDIERIKAVYYNEGYIQMTVADPEVVLDDKTNRLKITINIHEGKQFTISDLKVEGNTVFTSQELLDAVGSKPGDIVNRDQIRQDVEKITDLYGSKGYAFANITPLMEPDVEKQTVSLTLHVDENEKIFVHRIRITGNSKTRDNVIRREIPFGEGDVYDTSGLNHAKEELNKLDFFDSVEVVPAKVPDKNEVNLNVKVAEKSTGSFSVGGGYSTVDHLMAIGQIQQKNLFGRGQSLTLKVQWGSRTHNFTLSFIEPWLMGRPVSLGLEAFNEERNQSEVGYTYRTLGGDVSLGRRFWDYYSIGGTYSYAQYRFFDVSDEALQANPPGTFDDLNISKVGLNIGRDSRDNYIMPHRGSKNTIYGEISSTALGSSRSYYKAIADSTWYFPFIWDTVFSLHGRVGGVFEYGGSEIPANELFYMGGINTIRGYNWGSIGPKTVVTVNGNQEEQVIGGNKELLFNVEYTFPIFSDLKLYSVIFFDAGNVYGHGENLDITTLRYTAGGGFRWLSPMGLIRLEYGKVLDHTDPTQKGRWEFSIGTMF
jgi:outer membrane protein insertion porin family